MFDTAPRFLKVALGTGAVFAVTFVVALFLASRGERPVAATLADSLASLLPAERTVLEELCREAGIAVTELQLVNIWQLQLGRAPRGVAIEKGHVTALHLSGTPLAAAAHIGIFTELESLWLPHNQLTTLPSTAHLTKLRELNLRGNQLTALEPIAPKLEVLDLGNNQLTSIDGVRFIRTLQRLFAGKNAITSAEPLAGLRMLLEVDLDHNQLTTIEPVLGVKSLRLLYVRGNPLATAPPRKVDHGRLEVFAVP